MAENDPTQIDITPLKGVFSSMQSSLDRQTSLLNDILQRQKKETISASRANKLTAVATTANATNNILSGAGSAASGFGSGFGSVLGGLGNLARGGGIGMLAGLFALSAVDANQIKGSIETLLSIGENYENRLDFFAESGTLALSLFGLGYGLKQLAIGAGATVLVEWVSGVSGVGDWAQKVKDNVNTLLSISDGTHAQLSLLAASGSIAVALTGLGIGLRNFGVGQALVGLGQWITDEDWAEQVKSNVHTLLSISDGIGENISNLFEGAAFAGAMTGLAVGLGVFAVGQAAEGLAQFITTDDWAQRIRDNVETLLSISNLNFGSAASFAGHMTLIAAGLAVFGVGAAVAGAGTTVAEAGTSLNVEQLRDGINFLTGNSNNAPADWAQTTVNSINKLLELSNLSWGDTGSFAGHMALIATGLAVFGGGAAVAGVGTGIAEAVAGIRFFTQGTSPDGGTDLPVGWVNQIVHDITTLTNTDFSRASTFKTGMTNVAKGLVALFGAQGLGAVTGLLTELQSFVAWLLPGGGSGATPVQQMAEDINAVTNIIDQETVNVFNEFTNALGNLFTQFTNIGQIGVSAGLSDSIRQVASDIGYIMSIMDNDGEGLLSGGVWDDPSRSGGSSDNIDFGRGLRYYLNEGAGDIQVLAEGATVFRRALSGFTGMENLTPSGAPTATAPTATVQPSEDFRALLAATAAAATQAADSASQAATAAALAAQRAGGSVTTTNVTNITADPARSLETSTP